MFAVSSVPSFGRAFALERHCVRGSLIVWLCFVSGLTTYAYLRPESHTVFDIYLGASRRWLAGENLYERTREFYRYSPLFAVSLTPLAVLSDSAAAAIWKVVNCGVFALGLAAWSRRLIPDRLSRGEIATLFMLALPLSLHSMYNSQANLTMLGSTLLGLAAAAEGRWNRAAAWLAWATLIKGYPVALAMLVAGIYPRQFALKYVAALGLGLLLPFAAQTPELVQWQYANWFGHLADSAALMRERLRSVDHLFVLYGRPLDPAKFALTGAAAGVVAYGLCLFRAKQTTDSRQRLSCIFEWFALWVVLFGPATESCTYVVVAPVVAWRLLGALCRANGGPSVAWLCASLLMMGPLVTDMFGKLVRNFANEHGSQPLGAILLAGYLLSAMRAFRAYDGVACETRRKEVLPMPGNAPARPAAAWQGNRLRKAG